MAIAYPGFSEIYERWSTEVYRCCFLLVMEPEGAEQAALRAFLQLAVRTQAGRSGAARTTFTAAFAANPSGRAWRGRFPFR